MEIYVCGGAVRDVLLGNKPSDIDYVVIGATPQNMLDNGFMQVGADFPVFLHRDDQSEYALARTERKSGHGYNGFDVDFNSTITLEDDLYRRDLTINAMAVKEKDWEKFVESKDTKYLIDPYNGLTDLKNRILKHVSNAFKDDPLRVLRVARFAARYNFKVHPSTIKLMKSLAKSGELSYLTPERIWKEMERAIMEPYSFLFFEIIYKIKASGVIYDNIGLNIDHLELAHNLELSIDDRIAILFYPHSSDRIKSISTKLTMPVHITNYALKFKSVYDLLNSKITAQDTLNLLYAIGAYKNYKDFIAITKTIKLVFNIPYNKIKALIMSYNTSVKVSFSSLSSEERVELKGKDISNAIKKLQLESIEKYYR